MKRKIIIGVFLAIFLLTSKVNGIYAQENKPIDTIKIGTFSKAISYGPLYVAKHYKWFETDPNLKGINVTFTEFNDRPAISTALTAGELQLLFCAEIPAIVTSAQGNDIKIVKLSSTAIQRVIVQADSNIKEPKKLKGKKVAVLQATSSHYGLLKILKLAGLKETDVSISYMGPAEARAAFESKQLDAWAVWAPFGEQEEVKGTGREIGGKGAYIHSIMAVPTSLIKEHPEIVKSAIKIIQKGKQWIADHPKESQKIIAEEIGLDIAVVKKAWPKFSFTAQINNGVINDFQEKAKFLAELDKTRKSKVVDVKKELIDPKYTSTKK